MLLNIPFADMRGAITLPGVCVCPSLYHYPGQFIQIRLTFFPSFKAVN